MASDVKQVSVKLEMDFLNKLQPVIDDYYNGDRSACIRQALQNLLDDREVAIKKITEDIIFEIEFILNLVLHNGTVENKNLIKNEVLHLWKMIKKLQ